MNPNEDDRVKLDYASGEYKRALFKAMRDTGSDASANAAMRAQGWRKVLRALRDKTLNVGSRTPTAFPPWVTLEVLRGGFATGKAVAEIAPSTSEQQLVNAKGDSRFEIFTKSLSEEGTSALRELLKTHKYRIEFPEEAALLSIAWLTNNNRHSEAAKVLAAISPYAERLKFLPEVSQTALPTLDKAWLKTAGEASKTLANKPVNARVATMNEALLVWNPLADEFLDLWIEATKDKLRTSVVMPFEPAWLLKAQSLLDKYYALANIHRLNTSHTKRKSNLFVMRAIAEGAVSGTLPEPRELGLLMHVIQSMCAKRGLPKSIETKALRDEQRVIASCPLHATVAHHLAEKLHDLPQDVGIDSVDALIDAVSTSDKVASSIPQSSMKVLKRAAVHNIDDLINSPMVSSSEMLASLSPHISARTVADTYSDQSAKMLVAQTYKSFRKRRSLLLLDLQHQVSFDELPWFIKSNEEATNNPFLTARKFSALVLKRFPATVTPNAMVKEINTLLAVNKLQLPLVEELAADIFMGQFSTKYLSAAHIAAAHLQDSLYARYFNIDYRTIMKMQPSKTMGGRNRTTSSSFNEMCKHRANTNDLHSVAANGKVIEQAQILTTQNLATLWWSIGVQEELGDNISELARECARHITRGFNSIKTPHKHLRKIKNIAYAWRQMLFYLSLVEEQAQLNDLIVELHEIVVNDATEHTHLLEPAFIGLLEVANGAAFDPNGLTPNGGRLLTGWTTDVHWLTERILSR